MKRLIAVFAIIAGSVFVAIPAALADDVPPPTDPALTTGDPAPVAGDPAPVAGDPAPVAGDPAPVVDNRAVSKKVTTAVENPPVDDKKVVVCKYVGTPPGTPDHIIVVSVSELGKDFDGTTFPFPFGDAQDSIAIRYAVGNEQPGNEELVNCPGFVPPIQKDPKVTICHRTNSNTNPYVRITPSAAGVHNGHDKKHEGPVYNPTLKAQHIKWGDIIPPYTYNGVDYPGQNWTAKGRAIFRNGCKFTPPPPPPPPVPPAPPAAPEGVLPNTGGAPLWVLLLGGAMTASGVLLFRGARRPVAIDGSWGGGDASISLALPPKLAGSKMMAAPARAVVSSQAKSEWLMLAGGVVAAVAAVFFGSRLR